MAEVVDHVNEMEELRRAVKEDTEIQVRKEILSNVTSAEQVHVISEDDKATTTESEALYPKISMVYTLLYLDFGGSGSRGGRHRKQ